jgi:hypothetical protein
MMKICSYLGILLLLATTSVFAKGKSKNKQPSKPIGIANEDAFFDLLDLERAELAAVRKAVLAKDWKAAKVAWAKHLTERTSPKWLWSFRDKEKIFGSVSPILRIRRYGRDGSMARRRTRPKRRLLPLSANKLYRPASALFLCRLENRMRSRP